MMRESFKTPEGFDLYRPLLFPEVTDFTDLLTVERRWNFATMNHKWGEPQAETPEEITREGWDRVVSRFCSTRALPQGDRIPLMVTPTDMLLRRIYGVDTEGRETNDFAFFDCVNFEAIYHANNDRVLLVASASQILATRYLAYVHPDTVPIPDA